MAGKKNTEGSAEEQDNKVKPSEVIPMISGAHIKRLLGQGRTVVRDCAQMASEFGAQCKEAKKTKNLHLGVFKFMQRLDRMEPEELRLFMDHFEWQYDVSGLKKRADSVVKMNLGERKDDEEDETDDKGNVAKFPAATAGTA